MLATAIPASRRTDVGRPLFGGRHEQAVVAKLEYAFTIGSTATEACAFAGISTDSFYRFCRAYPEFRNRFEGLKQWPILMARFAIAHGLSEGSVKLSMWYLERKVPQEFSPRVAEGQKLEELQLKVDYLQELLRQKNISFSYPDRH